jgi:hypothetical protein
MTILLPGQLSDIALRGYVEPTRALSGRRSRGAWPTTAMLLATECYPIPGEPIAVGAYRLLDETVPGRGSLRLFYPDTTPERDIETITTYTREHTLPAPILQSELYKKIYYWIYRERVPLVCFSAPGALCQLAADWTRPKSPAADEFSLILWTRPDTRQRPSKAQRKRRPRLRNGEIENGDRPRIILKAIDGHRTIMRFTDRREADPLDRIPEAGDEHPGDKYRWPGRFVSLQQAVYSQVGEVVRNLADLLALYGLEPRLADGRAHRRLSGRTRRTPGAHGESGVPTGHHVLARLICRRASYRRRIHRAAPQVGDSKQRARHRDGRLLRR